MALLLEYEIWQWVGVQNGQNLPGHDQRRSAPGLLLFVKQITQ